MLKLLFFLWFANLADTSYINLDLYPLEPGNYWEYETTTFWFGSIYSSLEVTKDTLMENGKTYYELLYTLLYDPGSPDSEHTYAHYERIDSTSGAVYRYFLGYSWSQITTSEWQVDSLVVHYYDNEIKSKSMRDGPPHDDDSYTTGWHYRSRNEILFGKVVSANEVWQLWDDYKLQNPVRFSRLESSPEIASPDGQTTFTRVENIGLTIQYYDSKLIYYNVRGVEEGEKFTSADGPDVLPLQVLLHQNWPNPFNPSTMIRYELPVSGMTKLEVFDVLGRRVAVLHEGLQSVGSHEVRFDASNLSAGLYLYKLETGHFSQTRKMLLVK